MAGGRSPMAITCLLLLAKLTAVARAIAGYAPGSDDGAVVSSRQKGGGGQQATEAALSCHAECPALGETVLLDDNRHMSNSNTACNCDYFGCSPIERAPDLDSAGWYRFGGDDGATQMATCFVQGGSTGGASCGTTGCTGFLATPHPAAGDAPAAAQVCFNCGDSSGCDFFVDANVCACDYGNGGGTTYTYQLTKPAGGSGKRRYCGSGGEVCPPPPSPPPVLPEAPSPAPPAPPPQEPPMPPSPSLPSPLPPPPSPPPPSPPPPSLSPPPHGSVPSCPATCFGQTCDDWVSASPTPCAPAGAELLSASPTPYAPAGAEPPQHGPLTCVPRARPRRFPLNRPRPAPSSRSSAATASDARCAVVVALMRRPRASHLRLCQPPASRILRLHRPPACSPRSSASTAAVAMALTLRARLRPCVTH